MSLWLNALLLLVGSVMMALALVRAHRLAPRIAPSDSPAAHHRRAWKTLSILMGFFLVGYVVALLLLFLDRYQTLASLTAVIFAAGAWFVLLTVSLTVGLANSLLDASEDLDTQVKERTAQLEQQTLDLARSKLRAEEGSRAKSQFLANMSHELRTPLNSVVGFANVLRKNKDGTLGPKDLLYLDRIHHNGQHLLRLINDILDLSKVEAGRMEVFREAVNLEELLTSVANQFSAQLREKPIRLRVEVAEPVAAIETDVGKLRQVLLNLLGNALKFTHEGKVRVVLAVAQESRRPVRIDVVDTGIGIPSDRLGSIFETFRQADQQTNRNYGGTGLGLSISKSLCDLMGYQLRVRSRSRAEEGGYGPFGSTFSIHLTPGTTEVVEEPERFHTTYNIRPLTDSELAQTLAEELAGREVMVVADSSGIGAALTELRAQVVEAATADEAMDLLRHAPSELLMVDLTGPVGPRADELLNLHGQPGLPIVVVSDGFDGRALPAGIRRLPRSFRKSQLLTVLWRVLVQRHPSSP